MKIKAFFNKLAQYVYPKYITCNGCGKELMVENEYSLCDKCLSELKKVEVASVTYDNMEIFSCYEYTDLVKRMVVAYKDGNRPYLSEYMAKAMAKLYLEKINTCDVFCFVPSHVKTAKRRGYDAMKNVAKFFLTQVDIALLQEIKRVQHSSDQTKLNISERKQFVLGNFVAKENAYLDKTVLILDDLVTSGATLCECAKELISSGKAKKVIALTFARAV